MTLFEYVPLVLCTRKRIIEIEAMRLDRRSVNMIDDGNSIVIQSMRDY
jgi:hypothetical protein